MLTLHADAVSNLSLQDAWVRVASTVFNGASNVSQAGGIACLKVTAANINSRRPDVQEQAIGCRTGINSS
jgi:hypothetical protein